MKVRLLLGLFAAGASLTGCATFEGQPAPVITVKMSDEALASYRVPAVLREYGRKSGRAQRAYRDEVISVYIQAIDARYYQFRGNLSSEGKSTNLGFDTLLVGLVGAAALSANDADEIAAITTGALGLRSSVDKNLYFERTLPALLAAMDAERYKVRTAIANHMAQDTAQYPLAAAFVELQEYQQAGSLHAAVAAVTGQASDAREEARRDFEKRVRFTCDSEDAVNTAIDPVSDFLRGLEARALAEKGTGRTTELNRLRLAANAMGIDGVGTMDADALVDAVFDALLGGFCKVEEIDGLKGELRKANINFQ